ncbi:MAG: VaFE repeat-containing surface-anchored protein [Eubacterium sp.]|nr:VaFE repeat-containing surface-anchored protein [Eubacterium sp.]
MKKKRIIALLLAVLIVLVTNPVFGSGVKADVEDTSQVAGSVDADPSGGVKPEEAAEGLSPADDSTGNGSLSGAESVTGETAADGQKTGNSNSGAGGSGMDGIDGMCANEAEAAGGSASGVQSERSRGAVSGTETAGNMQESYVTGSTDGQAGASETELAGGQADSSGVDVARSDMEAETAKTSPDRMREGADTEERDLATQGGDEVDPASPGTDMKDFATQRADKEDSASQGVDKIDSASQGTDKEGPAASGTDEGRSDISGKILYTNSPDQGPSGTKDYVKRLVRDGNTVLFAHYDKEGHLYRSDPEMTVTVGGKAYTINTVCVRFDWSPGLDAWCFDVDKTEITDATVRQLVYHAVDKLEYSMAHRLLCYWLGKQGTVNGIDFGPANKNVSGEDGSFTNSTATGYRGMSVGEFISTYTAGAEAIPENVTFRTYYLSHDTTYEPSSAEWDYFQDFISWTKEVREPAKDYYVAFSKVDGTGKPVNDIPFSVEVSGVRVGDTVSSTLTYTPVSDSGNAEGYPASGWYFNATGKSTAARWPSISTGGSAAQAQPVYVDSKGQQKRVPEGVAIMYLGCFEQAPTLVLVQEQMTEAQRARYIAKYNNPYDLARHGYVFTDVETAIRYASDLDITWKNYRRLYVSLKKSSADPDETDGKDYYSLKGAQYKLFQDKAAAEKALAARKAGKPDYSAAVGTFTVKEDGTANTLEVTRLMDTDPTSGNLVNGGSTFYVVESVAPKNYLLSDEVASVRVTEENDETNPAVFDLTDEPEGFYGDIELRKTDGETDVPVAGIEFEIENLETHEKIRLITDEEGYAGTRTPENPKGTLKMGSYKVTEVVSGGYQKEEPFLIMVGYEQQITEEGETEWVLPKEGPLKGKVYTVYDANRRDRQQVITDMPVPELGTIALSTDPDEAEPEDRPEYKLVPAEAGQTVWDLCMYRNLRCGTQYTLVGTLMLIGEDGSVTPFTRADGSIVTGETVFTTKTEYEKSRYEAYGTEVVRFDDLDFTEYQGRRFVVYERLYLGTEKEGDGILTHYPESNNETAFPLLHEDPANEDQTVTVRFRANPRIFGTEAGITETEEISSEHQKIHVSDLVFYRDLTMAEGISYTVKGRLMNMDGTPAVIDGKEVTAEVLFAPGAADGTVKVDFPAFDFKLGESETEADFSYVVYEELYENRVNEDTGETMSLLIGEHKDPGAAEQTVTGHLEKEPEQPKPEDTSVKREPEQPKPEDTTVDRQPQTGDGTPLTILGILMAVAAIGALIMIRIRNKDNDKRK